MVLRETRVKKTRKKAGSEGIQVMMAATDLIFKIVVREELPLWLEEVLPRVEH